MRGVPGWPGALLEGAGGCWDGGAVGCGPMAEKKRDGERLRGWRDKLP